MFSSNGQNAEAKATKQILSPDYRMSAFNLITFGSDGMVNAYNDMMQGFYKGEHESDPYKNLEKFAAFILAIRKDLYNKKTKLKNWDMLKFMITDIEKITDKTGES